MPSSLRTTITQAAITHLVLSYRDSAAQSPGFSAGGKWTAFKTVNISAVPTLAGERTVTVPLAANEDLPGRQFVGQAGYVGADGTMILSEYSQLDWHNRAPVSRGQFTVDALVGSAAGATARDLFAELDEADAITLTLNAAPAWITLVGGEIVINTLAPGEASIKVTGTDRKGETGIATLTVRVLAEALGLPDPKRLVVDDASIRAGYAGPVPLACQVVVEGAAPERRGHGEFAHIVSLDAEDDLGVVLGDEEVQIDWSDLNGFAGAAFYAGYLFRVRLVLGDEKGPFSPSDYLNRAPATTGATPEIVLDQYAVENRLAGAAYLFDPDGPCAYAIEAHAGPPPAWVSLNEGELVVDTKSPRARQTFNLRATDEKNATTVRTLGVTVATLAAPSPPQSFAYLPA